MWTLDYGYIPDGNGGCKEESQQPSDNPSQGESSNNNDNVCEIDNCINCEWIDGEKTCLECQKGYGLSYETKSCVKCSEGCKKCVFYNGYEYCDSSSQCEEDYYVWDSSNRKCLKCDLNHCSECYDTASSGVVRCKECDEGYALDENQFICFSCEIDDCLECFVRSNGEHYCKKCRDNKIYDDDTKTCGTTSKMIMIALVMMIILI